jgi:GT2 family glycosyltransferase
LPKGEKEDCMSATKVFKIIKEEGISTFNYLIKEKFNGRKSEQERYNAYLKQDEPSINSKYLYECGLDCIDIITWDCTSTSKSLLKEVRQCQKEYICLQHTDLLLHKNGKNILNNYIYRAKKRNVSIDVIYGNEDCIEESTGKRSQPIFRPSFSPDTLMSYNYIGDFACIKKTLLLDCLNQVSEDSDHVLYEILLRLSLNKEVAFSNINTVLTHRVKPATNDYKQNWAAIKENILKDYQITAKVTSNQQIQQIQYIDYEYHNELISIIIPSKDNPGLLAKCITSIKRNTHHANYEIIVVDNGSSRDHEAEYRGVLKEYGDAVKYIYEPMAFNFSKMCNIGASHSSGKVLLFLNDDIEVLPQKYCTDQCKDWLEIMAAQALRKETGAVGAKLMYPDSNKIQHIGVVNYENAGLAHIYARYEDDESIKDYRNKANYNYLCVTGACIAIEKVKFDLVCGFNEQLAITHNDIELCFHLATKGFYQVQRNDVVLIHHESFSRGMDEENKEKELRNMKERDIVYSLYPDYERWDPYYSECLSQIEFNSSINRDIYSIIYHKPEKTALKPCESSQSEPAIHGRITSCQYREALQVRGYIYRSQGKEKAIVHPLLVIYNDKNTYVIRAKSICDRVFHERKGIDRHINYAPFFCGIDTIDMEKGQYHVGLYVDKKLIAIENRITI